MLISSQNLNRRQQEKARVEYKGKSRKVIALTWSQKDVTSPTESIITAWLEVSHLTSLDLNFSQSGKVLTTVRLYDSACLQKKNALKYCSINASLYMLNLVKLVLERCTDVFYRCCQCSPLMVSDLLLCLLVLVLHPQSPLSV